MQIEQHVPLAPFTTFNIGGPAKFFVRVANMGELRESLDFARRKGLKVFVLGGGSNVLVNDEGFDGLVIKIELAGVERDANTYVAAAGESWNALAARTVGDGLWGLENLSGIPGSVGGAVVQNIGAYGAALSEVLAWVEVYDTSLGEVARLSNTECKFGYRNSVFKHSARYVALRAAVTLSQSSAPRLSYKDLAGRFEGKMPSLQEIRDAVLAIRKEKFPDLSVEGTAGSFFLNPMVSKAEAQVLKERYPGMPLFDIPETPGVKVPLAWLLDHILSLKGAAVGGARLFERQPLVVATARGTLATDVKTLAQKIKQDVKEKIGIDIEEEVKILS